MIASNTAQGDLVAALRHSFRVRYLFDVVLQRDASAYLEEHLEGLRTKHTITFTQQLIYRGHLHRVFSSLTNGTLTQVRDAYKH
jgi:hypothetical protein